MIKLTKYTFWGVKSWVYGTGQDLDSILLCLNDRLKVQKDIDANNFDVEKVRLDETDRRGLALLLECVWLILNKKSENIALVESYRKVGLYVWHELEKRDRVELGLGLGCEGVGVRTRRRGRLVTRKRKLHVQKI